VDEDVLELPTAGSWGAVEARFELVAKPTPLKSGKYLRERVFVRIEVMVTLDCHAPNSLKLPGLVELADHDLLGALVVRFKPSSLVRADTNSSALRRA
jgi:hypothetical protein